MCLCITKQKTAHKGQARYRRQLLTGGGKRKLEKRNTRMSSDCAGFMSYPIHSSERFFYILLSLPSGSKEQKILSKTMKEFTAAKQKHFKAHNAPRKKCNLFFLWSESNKKKDCVFPWSESNRERKAAPHLQRAQPLHWATYWCSAWLSLFAGANKDW